MPSVLADLIVNLIGNDAELLAATKRSSAAMEGLAATAMATNTKMTLAQKAAAAGMSQFAYASATALGKVAAAGKYAGLALVGIGTYSVDAASKFQAAMELVHTQAGMSQSDVDSLSKSVLALAPAVGIGPDKLAEGLYHVASAFGSQGMPLNEMMDILTMAAKNAATGMSDMEDSTQAMVGVMAAGLPDIHNAADAAAYLNTTVGMGDMRMQQLSSAIATGVLPTFKEAGLGMTDFSAAVATLTDNVTPANQAATRLRMTIALLGAPSKAAYTALQAVGIGAEEANNAFSHRSELEKYGVNVSQLSADLQKPDGLLVAVTDLKTHLQKAGLTANEQAAVIERAFGGGRTSAAIQTLLDESDRLASKYKALGTQASRAKQQQDDWAGTQATFKQKTHELGAAIQVMAIQLGDKLLPILTKIVSFLTSHQAAMKAFFAVVLIGLTLMTAAWIAFSIAFLTDPVGLAVLAVIAAIVLLSIAIYELVTHWKVIWKFIKDIALDVAHAVMVAWRETMRFFEGIGDWIMKNVVDPVVHFFEALAHGVMDAVRWLEAIPGWLMTNLVKPIAHVLEEVGHIFMIIFRAIAVAVEWFTHYIIRPIADFVWNFLLIPVRLVLDLLIFAFKVAWGFISAVLADFWQGVKIVAGYIVEAWNWMVSAIKAYIDMWMGWLKAFWDWFVGVFWTNGILPIWHAMVDTWNWVYGKFKEGIDQIIVVFRALWDYLVSVWHGIYNGFIGPLVAAIKQMVYVDLQGAWDALKIALHALDVAWGVLWGNLKSAASGAWSFIKGIFDSIMSVIHDVENAFHNFESALNNLNPGNIGKSLWGALKGAFADGGMVPGHKGEPGLAVVHGGEYVLNTDQVDAIQGASVTSMMAPSSGAIAMASGGGGGPSQIIVNIDGKKLFDIMVQRSQRNKIRNNSTYLT